MSVDWRTTQYNNIAYNTQYKQYTIHTIHNTQYNITIINNNNKQQHKQHETKQWITNNNNKQHKIKPNKNQQNKTNTNTNTNKTKVGCLVIMSLRACVLHREMVAVLCCRTDTWQTLYKLMPLRMRLGCEKAFFFNLLYCIVLYCIVLYCIVLYLFIYLFYLLLLLLWFICNHHWHANGLLLFLLFCLCQGTRWVSCCNNKANTRKPQITFSLLWWVLHEACYVLLMFVLLFVLLSVLLFVLLILLLFVFVVWFVIWFVCLH